MTEPTVDVRFDHTIVPFLQVRLSDGRVLDFAEPGVDFPGQHFAFLVPNRRNPARSTPTTAAEASTSSTQRATTSKR